MIVRESIEDFLKPKSIEDIRKNFKSIIFWKGIIDGTVSPSNLNYLLDKNFINKKAKELWITKLITETWQRRLVYFLSVLKDNAKKNPDDKLTLEILSEIDRFDVNIQQAAIYTAIKGIINREYKVLNIKFSQATGKNLREEKNKI